MNLVDLHDPSCLQYNRLYVLKGAQEIWRQFTGAIKICRVCQQNLNGWILKQLNLPLGNSVQTTKEKNKYRD